MALTQATEPTTTSTATEIFNTEYISRLIEYAAEDPYVGERIVMRTVLGAEATSYTYQIVTANQFTGAAAVTQNDAAVEESFNPTAATISAARIGLRAFLVRQANMHGTISAGEEVVRGLVHAVRDDIHIDTLALFTSISASAGSNATNNTLSNWDTQTTAFRAGNHDNSPLWCVMNPDAVRDLRSDLVTNAAALFGSAWGDQAARALMNQTPGLGVSFDGFTVHESANTPAGDTTGWTNAMGTMRGLELVVWDPLMIKVQADESRYGDWFVAGTIVGIGIRAQKNLRAFITQT